MQDGERGGTPDQKRVPTAQGRQEFKEGERKMGGIGGNGAPPQEGGRSIPEEEARRIVTNIIKLLTGVAHIMS